ncbi:metallophosphoesterase [Caldisericum sp.]|uniref:metallophosphoesterase n=1 Tax=Caldisericum sp. TaxID=2499687 RepID=UPI003D12CB44
MIYQIKETESKDLKVEIESNKAVFYFLSDLHIDSKYCDKALLLKHLKAAKNENALIFVFGDIFDAMQTKLDRRHRKEDVDTKFLENGYLNSIVKFGVEFFEPYKENIAMLGYGNHELTLIKKHEFDIVKELAERLNVPYTGYEGFIQFNIKPFSNSPSKFRKVLYYTHGQQSEAPMTMGILSHKRLDVWVRDVDIIISGHKHLHWFYEQITMGITSKARRYFKTIYHLQLPTYLLRTDKYSYVSENLIPPPSLGGIRCEMICNNNHKIDDVKLKFERLI